MSDERSPRPWRVMAPYNGLARIDDERGHAVASVPERLAAALVGAVNAADARTPLAEVLAGLAEGKCP